MILPLAYYSALTLLRSEFYRQNRQSRETLFSGKGRGVLDEICRWRSLRKEGQR